MSLPEVMLWKRLRGRQLEGFYFRRQHPVGRYVLDFYCDAAKLAIEIDGSQHAEGDRPQRDIERDEWFAAHGIGTLRFAAVDVLMGLDGVLRGILEVVRERLEGKSRRASWRL